jgi:hypothetical protein
LRGTVICERVDRAWMHEREFEPSPSDVELAPRLLPVVPTIEGQTTRKVRGSGHSSSTYGIVQHMQ